MQPAKLGEDLVGQRWKAEWEVDLREATSPGAHLGVGGGDAGEVGDAEGEARPSLFQPRMPLRQGPHLADRYKPWRVRVLLLHFLLPSQCLSFLESTPIP